MKKILGLAVAVAFVATAAFVMAEEQAVKIVDKAKGTEVKATETVKTTAAGNKVVEKATIIEKAPGLKEEIKITEKFDYNACVKKCAANDTACTAKCDNLKKSLEAPKVAVEKKAPAVTTAATTAPKTEATKKVVETKKTVEETKKAVETKK